MLFVNAIFFNFQKLLQIKAPIYLINLTHIKALKKLYYFLTKI